MPRRFLKRHLPSAQAMRGDRTLTRVFGTLLHSPNLWHLNRWSVTWAVAIGLLMAFVPVPFQMVLAAAGAIALRCNLPVSVAMVWVTNPLTMGPIFYGSYVVGTLILDVPMKDVEFAITLEWLSTQLTAIWQPFLLGCAVVGVTCSLLGAAIVQIGWRIHVGRSWRARQARRRADASRGASS